MYPRLAPCNKSTLEHGSNSRVELQGRNLFDLFDLAGMLLFYVLLLLLLLRGLGWVQVWSQSVALGPRLG